MEPQTSEPVDTMNLEAMSIGVVPAQQQEEGQEELAVEVRSGLKQSCMHY